jgi:hypothetical protein
MKMTKAIDFVLNFFNTGIPAEKVDLSRFGASCDCCDTCTRCDTQDCVCDGWVTNDLNYGESKIGQPL